MNCHIVIACRAEGTLELHRFSNGILERLEVMHGFDGVNCLAYDASGHRLYASQTGEVSRVSVFNVFPGGDIEVAGSFDLPHQTAYISVAGEGLWSASYHGGNIAFVPLTPDGLPAGPAQVDSFGENSHCIVTASDGRHTYATSLRADKIAAYSVEDSQLRRRSVASVPPLGSGPRHLAFAGDSTLFALTEMSGEVIEFQRDLESGELTEVSRASIVLPSAGLTQGVARYSGGPEVPERPIWAADIQVAGELVFATERTTSTVTVLERSKGTGPGLEVVDNVSTEARPRASALSPDGEFYFVGGETSEHVSVYRVAHQVAAIQGGNATAANAQKTSPLHLVCRIKTGENPAWFAFLP